MASHRLAAILRSTGQWTEEEIGSMSEDKAWDWLRSNASAQLQADDETLNGTDDEV